MLSKTDDVISVSQMEVMIDINVYMLDAGEEKEGMNGL